MCGTTRSLIVNLPYLLKLIGENVAVLRNNSAVSWLIHFTNGPKNPTTTFIVQFKLLKKCSLIKRNTIVTFRDQVLFVYLKKTTCIWIFF